MTFECLSEGRRVNKRAVIKLSLTQKLTFFSYYASLANIVQQFCSSLRAVERFTSLETQIDFPQTKERKRNQKKEMV